MESVELLQDKKKFDEMASGVFNNIDSNKNGKIEFSEMKRAVQAMFDNIANKLNDEEIDQAILQLDKDQDSLLSRDELSALLRQILKSSTPEYTSDNEQKKTEPTSFRKKKILLTKEEKKQELKSLKKEIKELKDQNSQRKQLQNQRIVNVYLNPAVKDEELRQKQEMFDTQSVRSSNSSKSSISLNPLVINQNIRQGFFKNAEDVVKAASMVKNSHLIGMAVKRISAGEWQGLVDYFNEQTDYEFDRTPSSQQFHTISKKLSKNVKFILIHIQNLVYTNFKDLRVTQKSDLVRTDQPALFFWEVVFNGKSYFQNSAKELANQLNECLDSILVYNYINPIEVILWKKQGKDSVYVAQFDVTPQIFQAMRLVKDAAASEEAGGEEETKFKLNLKKINKSLRRLESQQLELYRKKRVSYLKKEEDTLMFGKMTVTFQMFEIFEYDAPINLISNVCGSPRSTEERARRRLVEDSKYGPYKWPEDQQNKALVILISDAGAELVIANEEDVKKLLENGEILNLIKETLYIDGPQGSVRANRRQKRKQLTQDQLNLVKELGDLPLVVEIDNLRKTIRQGRIPKKDLEAALQQIGLDPCKVLIHANDDLGDCPIDDMFGGSFYSAVIDTVQEMQFAKKENIVEADIFAEKFVNNIKTQLLLGDRLEPLFEFLKVAQNIPDFGITISLIADQFNSGLGAEKGENDQTTIDNGTLMSYFDINSRDFEKMENYEHVMILGKLLKLAKKHLKKEGDEGQENAFLTHLQQNHDEAKQKIYFTVPVLPKKMNLKEKAKLLTLMDDNVHIGSLLGDDAAPPATVAEVKENMRKKKEEIQQNKEELKPCLWNICHELARRKRWKMFFDGFAAAPEFYYQKDASGNAPLLDLFENGPFSVINQMISKYHPSNPNEDEKDIPKFDVKKLQAMNTKQGKSFLHAFALNTNQNPKGQIAAIKAFSPLIDPDKWKEMLVTPMKPHDATPLTLYVNRLANGSVNEDQPVIKEILQLFKDPIQKEYKPSLFRAKQLLATYNIEFDQDNLNDYYINHIQLTKAIAQLQPDMINLVAEEVTWMKWFGLNIEFYNGKATDIPYAIFNLVRQGKLQYLEKLLTDFAKGQDELPSIIQPDATFTISNDQKVFMTEEDEKVKIFDYKEEKTIEFAKDEMIEALAQFYNKYPLEILIGIKKILDESKFTTANLNGLIDNLILKIIKQEPRVLAKQFYIRSLDSPYDDLVKLGYENILKATLTAEQISAYKPKKISIAEDIFEEVLSGKMKDSEDGLKMDPKIKKQFFPQTQKMMTEKKLDDVLNFLSKIEKDKIPNRENVQKRLVMQIVQALPNSFAKSQYPKIFKMLKNDKLISSQQLKPLLNAALESNNVPLINNVLQYFWNKQAQAQRMKGVLRPMFQKYGSGYKAMMYHPAVTLNQAEFKKYMEDTKDTADLKDYEIAAKELVKFGQSERLPVFLKKLTEKRPEVVMNLLEETALKKIEGELTYPSTVPIPPKPQTLPVQKVQPQYIIPTKRVIIQSQQHLIDPGAIGALLYHARKLSEKQPHMPKSWNQYNHTQCLSAFQQMYQQKLRSAFLVQRPQNIFNNWSLPQPDSIKTLEAILDELNDDVFAKKPELKSKLENSDILPLVTKKLSIMDKLDKQDLRRFNSIERIILSNLKQKLTKEQLEIVDKRTYRNLEYLQKYFQPALKTIMEQEKKRTLRILRALELTFKRSQVALQIQFAVEVVLIITNSFQPADFAGIIDKSSEQIFNAFAVCLMRSKTEDQRALQFMGSQLNNYQFFDFVSSYAYDQGDGQMQQKNRKEIIKEKKEFLSIDTLPEKCEIEEASALVVPSQNNIQYIIKLLKAKVKPFFKTYQKEQNYANGEPFQINELKQLSLFEYLIVRCHFTLISKHYAKVFKPKNQLQENQIIKYLCLASSSGSYKLFDLITKEILNMDYFNLFKNFDASPDQQKYLNLPVFYQVITMSTEQSALLYFENIVHDQLSLELFYKWLQFDETWNCFVPIIKKKYSLLFTKIIQFLRKKLITDQKKDQFKGYYKELEKILNFYNFQESEQKNEDDESEQLTLLEYSILQGFPDLGMCVEPALQLLRNPYEGIVFSIIESGMKQCGQEFDQEANMRDYINKYQKEPDFYKVKYYQTYLVIKQILDMSAKPRSLEQKQRIQMELSLFYISIRFNKEFKFADAALIETVEAIQKVTFDKQFKILHFSRFDKVQKFGLSIVDYLQKYYPQLQEIWISKDIHAAFKTYMKYDFRDGLHTMNQDDLSTIDLDFLQPEVQMYILYNQPEIYINKGKDKFAFFSYKQLIPLMRYVSTKPNTYDIIKNIEDEDNPKYQFAAILMYYICSCDDKIIYVGETDPKANKIFLILEKFMETLSFREIDQLIVQLIQQMKANSLYDIVRLWDPPDPKDPKDPKPPINVDIYKEKNFIQGLLNFINKYKKGEKINFSYKLNDFLKLLQLEFVKNDKLYKDKLYRGLCIIHIVFNLLQEFKFLEESIESGDEVQVNIEILEFSKIKGAVMKTISISEILDQKEITGFKFQFEIPLCYQERNNVVTLFFHQNQLNQFEEILKQKRFEQFKMNDIIQSLKQESFVNQMKVTSTIKKNLLTFDNADLILEQSQSKFPFGFGVQYTQQVLELQIDEGMFVDGPSNYQKRKQLSIENELALNWYFDHIKYQFHVKLNLSVLKKEQSKISREQQLKYLIDDYTKTLETQKIIDKMLEEGKSAEEYIQLRDFVREAPKQFMDEEYNRSNELLKEYKRPPYFDYQLDWPLVVDGQYVKSDEYNFPQFTFKKIIIAIESLFQNKYLLNYISIIDTLLLPFVKMFEMQKKNQAAAVSIEDVIFQILDWPLLQCVMMKIFEKIGRSSVVFEFKEGIKPDIAKSLKLTGIDDFVQLSLTKYYLHRGLIIVRIGIYFNKKLLTIQNRADGQNLRYSQNQQFNDDITPYFNYIINEQQMQQILHMEQNA